MPGLYLISANSNQLQPLTAGFDAVADFQPNWDILYQLNNSLNIITYGRHRLGRAVNPKWALNYVSRRYQSLRQAPDTQTSYHWLQVVEYSRAAEKLSGALNSSYEHT